jgi:starch phosphorylase
MWQCLWPDEKDTIDHITNGVHLSTWVEPRMRRIYDKYLRPGRPDDHDNPVIWELIENIPDDEIWKTHYWLKVKLIDAIREQSRRRWVNDRANPSIILAGGTLLDPSVLTLGFARRWPSIWCTAWTCG